MDCLGAGAAAMALAKHGHELSARGLDIGRTLRELENILQRRRKHVGACGSAHPQGCSNSDHRGFSMNEGVLKRTEVDAPHRVLSAAVKPMRTR